MKTIIDSQYFPCVAYFSFLKSKEEVWIETQEHFVKQTYRNRCYILGSNQVLPLAIPMIGGNKKIKISDIKIEYKHRWLNDHWRAIISAYNKSPYFEFYEPYIHDILFAKHERLIDLNTEILSFCLKVLNIGTKINFTEQYESNTEGQLEDMRSMIHPKKDYICSKIFDPIPYPQLFGKEFAANLSVLDLLSNTGPESDNYL
ncbi:WbqC family protein [Reichenbachiella agariperforans]|uniref:WbqC-like protein family protein n=1 Tax=Reichenbachiella agariperforans TaxID=156994 RepID=A0A1M6QHS8_REIAG|nr:WbqC family protein [Reichenbachiella agariperforans]MBU2914378.1 WbqC family protein [Reichenbachiella agariperforans]SHK19715.1 WbqC-like protein family protein [Reichenbachiella agariperforans]